MNKDVSSDIETLSNRTYLGHTGYHFLPDDELAIEREFGEMLMKTVASLKPEIIVEIGTGKGYSTAWMEIGMKLAGRGKIYTYDHIDRGPFYWNGSGKIHQIITDFTGNDFFIPKKIDFLFHDSQHKIELIVPDLEKVLPRMTQNSEIWVHDAKGDLNTELKKYFEGIGWNYTGIEDSCGMGIAKR